MLFGSISRKTVWRHLKKSNALGSEWEQGWVSRLASGQAGLSLQQSLPTARRSEARTQRSAAAPSAEEGPGPKRTGLPTTPRSAGSSGRKRLDLQANPRSSGAPHSVRGPRLPESSSSRARCRRAVSWSRVKARARSFPQKLRICSMSGNCTVRSGEASSGTETHRWKPAGTASLNARAPKRDRGGAFEVSRGQRHHRAPQTETSGRRELERARAPQRDRAGTFEVSRERARARMAEVQFLGRSAVPRPRRAGGGAGPVPRTGSRFPVGLLPAP